MDIKNLGEFVNFVQDNSANEMLSESAVFAERLADLSVAMRQQYGGHGEGMESFIGDAFTKLEADGEVDRNTLEQAHEILIRFWEHGEAFDTWFATKVVLH